MESISFLALGIILSISVLTSRVYIGIKNDNYSFIGSIVLAIFIGFFVYFILKQVFLSIIIGCGVAAFWGIGDN